MTDWKKAPASMAGDVVVLGIYVRYSPENAPEEPSVDNPVLPASYTFDPWACSVWGVEPSAVDREIERLFAQ